MDALVIRRAGSRAASSEASLALARAKARILTSQDLARAVPPSETEEIVIDEVHNQAIRAGDVLVSLIGRRLTARVAEGEGVDACLSPTVYLIWPDTAAFDPWFLAGVLSSAGGDLQVARMVSPLGDRIRFDPRRVRVPSSRSRTSASTASLSAASGVSPASSAPPTTKAPPSSATSSTQRRPCCHPARLARVL